MHSCRNSSKEKAVIEQVAVQVSSVILVRSATDCIVNGVSKVAETAKALFRRTREEVRVSFSVRAFFF